MSRLAGAKLRAHLRQWRSLIMVAIVTSCALAPATATADEPPELLSFGIQHIFDNYWLLYGEVDDEVPEYCIIGFGGILDGHGTVADADGTFSYAVELSPNTMGYVSAQALDGRDQYSNILEDFLYQ